MFSGMTTDWFATAISIEPTGLGWSLHRGVLADGRIGWVLRQRDQAFQVLDVPEMPGPSTLTKVIAPFAGQYAADTLVRETTTKARRLLADTWQSV
jgi:hypothetical protein